MRGYFCVYICLRQSGGSVHIYRSTWAGFTLLILKWGQCESLKIGISTEELTPTSFFVSTSIGLFVDK